MRHSASDSSDAARWCIPLPIAPRLGLGLKERGLLSIDGPRDLRVQRRLSRLIVELAARPSSIETTPIRSSLSMYRVDDDQPRPGADQEAQLSAVRELADLRPEARETLQRPS
jgi:hypothetical protein